RSDRRRIDLQRYSGRQPCAALRFPTGMNASGDDSDMREPTTNGLGQPIGFPVPDWSARPRPPRMPMQGRYCRLEPLDPARHADELYDANSDDREGRNWTYLAIGPFPSAESYRAWVEKVAS